LIDLFFFHIKNPRPEEIKKQRAPMAGNVTIPQIAEAAGVRYRDGRSPCSMTGRA